MFKDQDASPIVVFSGGLVHAVAIALLLLFVSFLPKKVYESILPARIEDFVHVVDPGPGGGGGGGNKSPDPPKKAELPKVVEPPKPTPLIPEPVPVPTEPVLVLVVGVGEAGGHPGAGRSSTNPNASATSRGSGTGTGAGPGKAQGLGPAAAAALAAASYNLGNGVTRADRRSYQPKPKYTADAMRAKVQGTVVMSAVVMPDGTVTIFRSFARWIRASVSTKKRRRPRGMWRFRPGRSKASLSRCGFRSSLISTSGSTSTPNRRDRPGRPL